MRATIAILLSAVAALSQLAAQSADQARRETGIATGLAVVLGSTDGKLEADLAADGRMVVQGLALDAHACAAARAHLFAQGIYGQAVVDHVATLAALPFYDRLVNLVVADLDALGKDAPAADEITRVLGFGGAAYLRRGGTWAAAKRPVPSEVAEFTHYHYDATRSNRSPDTLVGPPNALRWVGQPTEHNGWNAPRVAQGVAVMRSGVGIGNKSPEEKIKDWDIYLCGKDAASGVMLWKREQGFGMDFPEWGSVGKHLWVWRRVPYRMENGTMIEHAGNVYLDAWDIRSGETVHSVLLGNYAKDKETKTFFEKLFPGKSALSAACLSVKDGKVVYAFGPRLVVRDEATARVLWEQDLSAEKGWFGSFVIDRGVVAALVKVELDHGPGAEGGTSQYKRLVAYAIADGREVWRHEGAALWQGTAFGTPDGSYNCTHLTGYRDGLLPVTVWHAPKTYDRHWFNNKDACVTLLEIETGKRRWSARGDFSVRGAGDMNVDHYIVGDRLYIARLNRMWAVYDLASGARVEKGHWESGPRTSNCCSGVATGNYMVLQRMYMPWDRIRAFETTGPSRETKQPHYWYVRLFSLGCHAKIAPAYGTSYLNEGSCNCVSFLSGSMAIYGQPPTAEIADAARLTKAYPGALPAAPVAAQERGARSTVAMDWHLPPGRTGMTWSGPRTPGPGAANNRARGSSEIWGYSKSTIGPIRAGGLEITGHVHEHRVTATRDGKPAWHFVTGGRLGSRGTLQHDAERLYVPCHDGSIYALNLKDGSLAWRFLAAPADRRMVAYGQVESAWPIFNLVLHQGRLYGIAGRHREIDGGLHAYGIEAASGKLLWHRRRACGIPVRGSEGLTLGGGGVQDVYQAANTELVLDGDQLVLHHGTQFPLRFGLDGFEDAVRDADTRAPPEFGGPTGR